MYFSPQCGLALNSDDLLVHHQMRMQNEARHVEERVQFAEMVGCANEIPKCLLHFRLGTVPPKRVGIVVKSGEGRR